MRSTGRRPTTASAYASTSRFRRPLPTLRASRAKVLDTRGGHNFLYTGNWNASDVVLIRVNTSGNNGFWLDQIKLLNGNLSTYFTDGVDNTFGWCFSTVSRPPHLATARTTCSHALDVHGSGGVNAPVLYPSIRGSGLREHSPCTGKDHDHALQTKAIVVSAVLALSLAAGLYGARRSSLAGNSRPAERASGRVQQTEPTAPSSPALAAQPIRAHAREPSRIAQASPAPAAEAQAAEAALTAGLDAEDIRTGLEPVVLGDDETMYDNDNRPEQREWRLAWLHQKDNPAWTTSMQSALQDTAGRTLSGELSIVQGSCHETLCIMTLQFEDELEAAAFKQAPHEPGLHFEFQSLDPRFKGEGYDASDYTYELIVKREDTGAAGEGG